MYKVEVEQGSRRAWTTAVILPSKFPIIKNLQPKLQKATCFNQAWIWGLGVRDPLALLYSQFVRVEKSERTCTLRCINIAI